MTEEDLQKIAGSRAFTLRAAGSSLQLKTELHIVFPDKSTKKYTAVWDTGATGTVISRELAKKLGLSVYSHVNIDTAGGNTEETVHYISLMLPSGIHIPRIPVATGVLKGFDFLIGMDIITLGDFSITNVDEKTVFSFRFPSIETIDYVKAANNAKLAIKRLKK